MTKLSQAKIDLDRVAAAHARHYRNGEPSYGPWFREMPRRERDVLGVLWRCLPSVRALILEQAAEAEFRAGRSWASAVKAWDRAVARLDEGARARLAKQRPHLVRRVGRGVDPLADVRVALCDEAGLTPTEIGRLLGSILGEPNVHGSARLRTHKSIDRARERAGNGPGAVTPIRPADVDRQAASPSRLRALA